MKRKARFKVVRRKDGRYDWKLVASNGRQLCGSDQGYERRSAAREIGEDIISGVYADAKR